MGAARRAFVVVRQRVQFVFPDQVVESDGGMRCPQQLPLIAAVIDDQLFPYFPPFLFYLPVGNLLAPAQQLAHLQRLEANAQLR